MTKRMVFLCFAFVMLLSFVSCKGKKTPVEADGGATPTDTTEAMLIDPIEPPEPNINYDPIAHRGDNRETGYGPLITPGDEIPTVDAEEGAGGTTEDGGSTEGGGSTDSSETPDRPPIRQGGENQDDGYGPFRPVSR